jgi:hypothetical protein
MSITGEYAPAAGPVAEGETVSPFGEVLSQVPDRFETTPAEMSPTALESPFGSGFTRELDLSEAELLSETAVRTLAELEQEEFTDALEALVDEASARHVTDSGVWSVPPSAEQAQALLEEWIEPLAGEAERMLEEMAYHLAGTDPQTVSEVELGQLLEEAGQHTPTGNEAFDNFLGSLINKARKAVSGAVSLAKKGIALAGKFMPINLLLGKLKDLVRPLLNRVLQAAIGKLPQSVQPIARTLAGKLGLSEAELPQLLELQEEREDAVARLAAEFDVQLTGLLLAPDVAGDPRELEGYDAGESDPVAELDDARARLAERLAEAPAGTSPVAEIEQFIPVVMALKPLIKLGVSMIGRDKVIGFIADRIAGLVQPLIGADASRQLARPLVDVGLRALGFEMAPADPGLLAGEAVASAVEGTVMRLTELPAETFADELQLETAIQSAFAEAAASAVPAQLLRPDLPERETAGEGGFWILMPRQARPKYRYRRYTKVFAVPITRQIARSVPWSDGGSLESYLLDRGAERWPVNAEVQLFETLPGSQLGHVSAGEASGSAPGMSELQPLTPEVAGLLLREPGLGRGGFRGGFGGFRRPFGGSFGGSFGHRGGRPGHHRPWAGRRYFRVRPLVGGIDVIGVDGVNGVNGTAARRPRHKLAVHLTLTGASPSLRVAIRLSERQGQQLLNRLDPAARRGTGDLPGAMAELTAHLQSALPTALNARLIKHGVAADAAAAGPITERVSAGTLAALSEFLSTRAHLLASAVRDPAQGVTVTVTFAGISKESLATALPAGQVSVTPGWGRHG